MNPTHTLHALGQRLWVDNITRSMLDTGTLQRCIDTLQVTGLSPQVMSVASVFVSRWDVAVKDKVPQELHNRRGIAVCEQTYQASLHLLASPRWQRQAKAGALPQRVLSASTGTKDPQASDTLYVDALAAPDTINTLPEKTLLAFADHGRPVQGMTAADERTRALLTQYRAAGIDLDALALQLQQEGADAFVTSWRALLARIVQKSQALLP